MFNIIKGVNPISTAFYPFEDSLMDKSKNQFTLTDNGTTPFATVNPMPFGNKAIGPLSDTNYLKGSAALNTALSSPASKYIIEEMYFYCNQISNGPVLTYRSQNFQDYWIQVVGGAAIKCHWFAGGAAQTADGLISLNKWYYVAVSCDANLALTTIKLWCCEANKVSGLSMNNPLATATIGTTQLTTVANTTVGRYLPLGSYYLNGYIKNYRIGTKKPDRLPIMD